jgi:hypothetical protein
MAAYVSKATMLGVVLVTLGLLATPASAASVAPAQRPSPSDTVTGPDPYPAPPFDDPAGHTCSFALHVSFPVNKVKVWTYRDASGRVTAQSFTGALWMTAVRRDDGARQTVNLSGDGQQIFRQDGSSQLYGFGPYAAFMHPGDHPGPQLAIVTGVSRLTITPDGHKRLDYSSKPVTNLCTRLH